MLSNYLSITFFDTDELFAAEARRYVEIVKSARSSAPDGEVLTLGKPERRTREARLAKAFPLPPKT